MGRFASMRGPTARLERFAARLDGVVVAVLDRVSGAAEKAVPGLIEKGYASRTSPYGTPWPQPKAGNKPMERNGKLRKSYEVIRLVSGKRWMVWASNNARSKGGAYYGAILQKGFRHHWGSYVAPRKQVPDAGKLPPRWAERLRDVAQREGDRVLAGVGR